MRNNSSTRSAKIVLVSDDAVVIRAKRVIQKMKKATGLRPLAADLGVSHSALWRFLRDNGYEEHP